MPPDEPSAQPKLNILALPSHTAILFALILTVALGAALATLLPGSRLWWPPFVFGLTLLPLRDFLHRPDRIRRQRRLQSPSADTAPDVIQRELAALAELNAQAQPAEPSAVEASPPKTPPVRVLTTPLPIQMEAFGTFRRQYIGMSEGFAATMSRGLREGSARACRQYRAMLAHELAHFLNRDVRLTSLALSMLKMLALVMILDLWIGVVLAAFVIEFGPEVLRLEFWTQISAYMSRAAPGFAAPDLTPLYTYLTQIKPELTAQLADPALRSTNWQHFLLYLVGAQWPFFIVAVVLLAVFWPRLLAVRELYADARAASLVGESALIPEAIGIHALLTATWHTGKSSLPARARAWVMSRAAWLSPAARNLRFDGALPPERLAALGDPLVAFGPWPRIAVAAGLAVILLDLALRSTLAATFVAEPGAHLPFLIGFLTFSTWLLPRVCDNRGAGRDPSLRLIAQLVAVFTAVKLSLHFLDGLLMLGMVRAAPETLGRLVDAWVYAIVGAGGANLPPLLGVEVTWDQFLQIHVARPILFYLLLMPPTLILFLWADTRARQRALTWYGDGAGVKRAFWWVTAVLAAALVLVVVPLFNHLLFPEIYSAWSWVALAGMAVGLLTVVAGTVAFIRCDRTRHGRCPIPGCEGISEGAYQLGATCPRCGARLHAWLAAAYDAPAERAFGSGPQ